MSGIPRSISMPMRIGWMTVLMLAIGGSALAKPGSPPPSYWERRRVVYFHVESDSVGKLLKLELIDNQATKIDASSLEAQFRSWSIPWDAGIPTPEGHFELDAAVAMDRREKWAPGEPGERLPESVHKAMGSGSLTCWFSTWRAADPSFSLEDFIAHGAKPMPRLGGARLLQSPQLRLKERFAMLRRSPNARWVLDPFAGVYVDSTGDLGADVDRGFEIYDAKSGDRLLHEVGAYAIDQSRWLSPNTFLLVGTMPVYYPHHNEIWVPAIWIGDVENGTLQEFLGAPVPPLVGRRIFPQLRPCWKKAHPQLSAP